MKCIVRHWGGAGWCYLTPRRGTGRMYEARSSWTDDVEDAKIFQSKGAASNSARQNLGHDNFEVCPVTFTIGDPL